MINLTLIQPTLFVGTYPQSEVDLDRLRSGPKITAVLNLQTDEDFQKLGVDWERMQSAYLDRDMLCQRWPITDFSPSDLETKLDTASALLNDLIDVGHRVYVHCTAGVCRAPAAAIGYLTWHQNMDLEGAYEMVRKLRACDPYIDVIRAVHAVRTAK